MKRIGIVGCGAIGASLARVLARDDAHAATVSALADRDLEAARRLQRQLPSSPAICSIAELVRRVDLVIEAASLRVAGRVARLALEAGRDVLIMSTGGLLAQSTRWAGLAKRSSAQLLVPSGGLCGVDGLKAMAVGSLRRVRLTTRKPPAALAGAPYVQARRIRLAGLRRPLVLLEGPPARMVRAFPQNANVAATLALACAALSSSRRRIPMRVRMIADPALRTNVHELEVEADCGRMSARMESRPSSRNPKTSEVAIRSALATLHQYFAGTKIGT